MISFFTDLILRNAWDTTSLRGMNSLKAVTVTYTHITYNMLPFFYQAAVVCFLLL